MEIARRHHYAPQFYLRNFAVDDARSKIETVSKHGSRAVWAKRSLSQLGFEIDLYVHMEHGYPVSVESTISKRIETPISQSDTWAKIVSGRSEELDRSDKPILYALIRHLEFRTPHARETIKELTRLAALPENEARFSDEEREMYALFNADPEYARGMLNAMSAHIPWTERDFRDSFMGISRAPVDLRSSTTPVLAIRGPQHPNLSFPLPNMIPYQLILPLNRTTFASLIFGSFDDAFVNRAVSADIARGFNRHFVGQFAYFTQVKHLITDRKDLIVDMMWAPYDLLEDTERRITFLRRPA